MTITHGTVCTNINWILENRTACKEHSLFLKAMMLIFSLIDNLDNEILNIS